MNRAMNAIGTAAVGLMMTLLMTVSAPALAQEGAYEKVSLADLAASPTAYHGKQIAVAGIVGKNDVEGFSLGVGTTGDGSLYEPYALTGAKIGLREPPKNAEVNQAIQRAIGITSYPWCNVTAMGTFDRRVFDTDNGDRGTLTVERFTKGKCRE